jgi:hypothetical protein
MSAPGRQRPEIAVLRQASDRPQDGPMSGLRSKALIPKRAAHRASK